MSVTVRILNQSKGNNYVNVTHALAIDPVPILNLYIYMFIYIHINVYVYEIHIFIYTF